MVHCRRGVCTSYRGEEDVIHTKQEKPFPILRQSRRVELKVWAICTAHILSDAHFYLVCSIIIRGSQKQVSRRNTGKTMTGCKVRILSKSIVCHLSALRYLYT